MSSGADDLLSKALASLRAAGADLAGYTFIQVKGTTQATVWKGTSHREGPAVALRLTPKPFALLRRIGALMEDVRDVECPRTLQLAQLATAGRMWTVQVCTWIGIGTPVNADMRLLGRQLARLHRSMAASAQDFTDRPLTFERHPASPPAQQVPAWSVARDLWRDRIYAGQSLPSRQVATQPIHGDLHWGNIVGTQNGGFGFIDFDKVMFAPPVFDLAKLIVTGLFGAGGGGRVRFHARKATELLQGYESIRALSDTELVALEGLAVLIAEETARLGKGYGVPADRPSADAVATWWIARRLHSRSDPLGIRASRQPASRTTTPAPTQDALWTDENTGPN